jgi:hypothetical protein
MPIFSPTDVHISVGEVATVQVHVTFSGLLPNFGDPVNESFCSDDESVATGTLTITDHDTHTLEIVGVSPGFASIRSGIPGQPLGGWRWVRVSVDCGPEIPIRPILPVLQGSIGVPVVLIANGYFREPVEFKWYQGRTGDVTHPLAASGSEIAFKPAAYGQQYVWVVAHSICSSSTAEFRIDVPLVRRRAASH